MTEENSEASKNKTLYYDIVIVGSGVGGLFAALALDKKYKILIVTKKKLRDCDSYLAQGGMCVLKSDDDFDLYMEDTLKAGHYKNRIESVKTMISDSRSILKTLLGYGVPFNREKDGSLSFTREGGHSTRRIVHCEDETGKAITEKLIEEAKKRDNIDIFEDCEMVDLLIKDNTCYGLVVKPTEEKATGTDTGEILSSKVILATGGIGGLYKHSTNFRHIKGDSIAILQNYGAKMENLDYIQFHPTSLYEKKDDRKYLLSESMRGEGAVLLNSEKKRFTDELKPRDVVTKAIRQEMEKEGSSHVYLSMKHLDGDKVKARFPYIYEMCLEHGYDLTKDDIPIVPAQHYHMGGIYVDQESKTSINNLFAVGECSCNGVHGQNRLASNSLLESMVFAQIIAKDLESEGLKPLDKEKKAQLAKFKRENLTSYETKDYEAYKVKNHTGLREKIEKNDLYGDKN